MTDTGKRGGAELTCSRKKCLFYSCASSASLATPDLECRWGFLGECGRSRQVEGNPRNVALRAFCW